MSKWFMRCIAALLLLTFQPGLPVPVQIQHNENNAPHAAQSVFNLELVSAAEAAEEEKDDLTTRCGKVGGVIFLLAVSFIPGCLPVIMGLVFCGVIIYLIVNYLFTGKGNSLIP